MTRSSYINDITYGDLISSITFSKNPKKIVEIGILDGFSLSKFAESSHEKCVINAYDIFEEFNGNHADMESIKHKFEKYKNVTVEYGNFYDLYKNIEDHSVDILHIDIANNGDVLQFVVDKYLNKIKFDGIIIFEGGSNERDNVEWMKKYDKPKINSVAKKLNDTNIVDCITIGTVPSITIIKHCYQ